MLSGFEQLAWMELSRVEYCQELDGSWLLGVSKTVMLWVKGSVVQWVEI